ncbi:TPA: integrase arm-type DNA-binding domain-containing protein [Pseudomonas aeruginosa]|uniref:tyrosine-type recombinase/integrase n=1 Tax=Gammaproteobacteria TaxID=1236 RepID=UPI000DCD1235|nr:MULTISPECIES: integrase arm-type DNA-binding domain-containing protein [Gammaproteobacteria]EKX9402041.1 integrase arm-type DNA-binding domain-containing protein [Klebsiella pneumoniae]EIU3729943.1 integrase arm-type DNA-binding domain-containing protein [Pseudomonas aeruginosa]EKU9633574.1 integrase arm-type DNA-binding domain-containing protein [Pseudomonas aeruginosa]EKU9684801.1 integrase arm-type DNA-binding domain-containing protein [Pseudomonas aeruginosa]EKU9702975.1 integrase arm-t
MALSDLVVRQAKATGKAYTLPDIDGLSLAVTATGSKSWHFRYYWMKEPKRMSLGTYPEVSLREARALRDEARALVAKDINPRLHRKQKRAAVKLAGENTFEAIYKKWLAHRELGLKKGRQTTLSILPRVFAKDVLPLLGKRSIYDIKRPDLLEVIARIERRKALSVAEKVRTWFNQMFRYALVVVPGLEQNPASDLDVVALPLPPVNHNPFLRMAELPKLLQRLRKYRGRLQTQLGLRLLLFTGVRTGELRLATPDQFDLDRGLWIIPPEVVKQLQVDMRRKRQLPKDIPPYIVPLSVQAIEIVRHLLEQLKPAQHYLFRHDSELKKRMSENTLNGALKRMGYRDLLTGHGIRGTMSTALNEIGYPKVWVDAQLSHVDPNKVSATYNHAEYVEQRRRMMQDWADRLDLFEQNMVEVASMPLTIHLEGVPVLSDEEAASAPPKPAAASAPLLIVTRPGDAMPLVSAETHRLPAVPLPRSVMEEPLSDIQRQRMELVDVFEAPHNLPVAEYAKMAGKSRRWISYEIKAGNLLALNLGNRGQRVPDWHLDPVKHALIQAVLKLTRGADPWQIYNALLQPRAKLRGGSALESVSATNLDKIIMAVSTTVKESEWSPQQVAFA